MGREQKLIYGFDQGDATMRDLLGNKGANLCEMTRLGLPVPPGFTITTDACRKYYDLGFSFPDGLWEDVRSNVARLEGLTGRRFGSPSVPLLLSVRSGTSVSMPGMLSTVLNVGVSDGTVTGLATLLDDERAALDVYRRFTEMFGTVVLKMDTTSFSSIVERHKDDEGVIHESDLSTQKLQEVILDFHAMVERITGKAISQKPWEQLEQAVHSVFASWNSERALTFRNALGISHDLGTAVSVMAMVFGNKNERSGTGVLFTRNPSTGSKSIYGEYLPHSQGEDIVSGKRTPNDISSLAYELPSVYGQLKDYAAQLELHFRDMQEIEFTVESEQLYLLQTRRADRTPMAAVRSATELANEGIISHQEGLSRLEAQPSESVRLKAFRESDRQRALLLARGIGASPGASSGHVFLDSASAIAASEQGIPSVLVRPETSTEDIGAILTSVSILTVRGGVTSHAAVVARSLGKVCVVGCEGIHIDLQRREITGGGLSIREGDSISLDGTTGEIFVGLIPIEYSDL